MVITVRIRADTHRPKSSGRSIHRNPTIPDSYRRVSAESFGNIDKIVTTGPSNFSFHRPTVIRERSRAYAKTDPAISSNVSRRCVSRPTGWARRIESLRWSRRQRLPVIVVHRVIAGQRIIAGHRVIAGQRVIAGHRVVRKTFDRFDDVGRRVGCRVAARCRR